MSFCLDLIAKHRSIRKFKSEPVNDEDLGRILEAARRHPSPRNLQPLTITVVEDERLKGRIATLLGGQQHVEEAPVLLVFSLDLMKVLRAVEISGNEPTKPSHAILFAGTLSTGIALAWSLLAAESLGYGACGIAVYRRSCEVADLLKLPKYVLPLAGLLVGRPDESPELRPRQPLRALLANDGYGDPEERAKVYSAISSDFQERLINTMGRGGFYDEIADSFTRCLHRQGLLG